MNEPIDTLCRDPYAVYHDGPIERHVFQVHQTDLALAVPFINKEKYRALVSTDSLADKAAALALVLKSIEVAKAEKTPSGEPSDGPQSDGGHIIFPPGTSNPSRQ